MSSAVLYLSDGYKIKSFTGKTAGKKSIVTIRVEISDLWELAYFLEKLATAQQKLQSPQASNDDLGEQEYAKAQQRLRALEAKKSSPEQSSEKQEKCLLEAPMLRLPAPTDRANEGEI